MPLRGLLDLRIGHWLLALIVIATSSAYGQWSNFPTPGTPRTRDGKVNLDAAAPHALDGKPDLSGVWMHEKTSVDEVRRLFGNRFDFEIELSPAGMEIGTQHKYAWDILLDFKGQSLMRPEAEAVFQKRASQPLFAKLCTNVLGFPLAGLLSEPIKIVQAPRLTMILYEAGYLHRQIFTDGRKLPMDFDLPAYLGYSVGHWDRDTMVVETAGFNEKTSLDAFGHPHSDALHVTERFHRRDFGHLDVEMTFDDPKMYTKPFTIKVPHYLLPDADIFEMFCNENEKDRVHLEGR
jgi:hypothetical protein